jgi:hypothetical protein
MAKPRCLLAATSIFCLATIIPISFAAPGDPQNHRARQADPLRNPRNNPSYILNGDNDLGTFEQPNTGAAGVARSTNFLSPSPRDFHPAG